MMILLPILKGNELVIITTYETNGFRSLIKTKYMIILEKNLRKSVIYMDN